MKFPVRKPIVSSVRQAIVAGLKRWFLNLNGIDAYMTIPEWSMLGYGDRIVGSINVNTLDATDQIIYDNTASDHDLRIVGTTDVLTKNYIDVDGSTLRSIAGPTLVAGQNADFEVIYKADGVDLIVGGVTYSNANTPELLADLTSLSEANSSFHGTIHDIRLVSATSLQNTYAVQGNGVDLYGAIPGITLTGDFEIEFDWVPDLSSNNRPFGRDLDSVSRGLIFTDGVVRFSPPTGQAVNTPSGSVVSGQHHRLKFTRVGTTGRIVIDGLEQASGAFVDDSFDFDRIHKHAASHGVGLGGNLKITDQSNAEDVVFEYDLSGNDGSTIPALGAGADGTWNNYTPASDQVFLPLNDRDYPIDDGPGGTSIRDKLNAANNGTQINTIDADWYYSSEAETP